MKRAIAGILIAPIIWPFVASYLSGEIYILLTGTTIEQSWKAGFYNLHLYWWGYGLMIICGIPLILICRKCHWNKLWHFLLGAGILALIAPIIYFVGAAVIFEPKHVSLSSLVGLIYSLSHMLLSGIITFVLVFLIYWHISVKNNEWFST